MTPHYIQVDGYRRFGGSQCLHFLPLHHHHHHHHHNSCYEKHYYDDMCVKPGLAGLFKKENNTNDKFRREVFASVLWRLLFPGIWRSVFQRTIICSDEGSSKFFWNVSTFLPNHLHHIPYDINLHKQTTSGNKILGKILEYKKAL